MDTDTFEAPFPISQMKFTRATNGRIAGFAINEGRVRNLKFSKVEIKPVD